MRLVLDLIGQLVSDDCPGPKKDAIRQEILDTLVALIVKESTRPQAKSAIGSVEHLLGKEVLSIDEVGRSFRLIQRLPSSVPDYELWRTFCCELFSWADLPHVCAVAGKLLVTILRELARLDRQTFGPHTWRVWLQEFIAARPSLLEPAKNYILAPLSKTDRPGFLELLRGLNRAVPLTEIQSGIIGTAAFFQLSVLEVGKKNGLVEEPGW